MALCKAPAAGLHGRQRLQFRRQLIGRIGRHRIFGKGNKRDAHIRRAAGAIDGRGRTSDGHDRDDRG